MIPVLSAVVDEDVEYFPELQTTQSWSCDKRNESHGKLY